MPALKNFTRRAAGRFWKTGQKCGFRQVQLRRRFPKIASRGSLDTIGAAPEINLVKIQRENVLLGQILLDTGGQYRLFDFSGKFALRGQEQRLYDLLGDGTAALLYFAGFDVFQRGPDNTPGIDSLMLEKFIILGG